MPDKPTIFLLDASGYIHRAFHAVKGLATSDGVPTGAVFGFVNMLLKVLAEARPSHLAVVYDAKGPTFRHQIFPAYKANRPPMDPALKAQLPLVRQLVTALCLPAVEMEGFEADDLMATLARQAREQGFEVVLVSADKDLLQLVGPGVSLWDTMKDLRLGPEEVRQKTGLPPELQVDMQALTGDASDNVPGVPGVGPKTAVKLLAEHPGLEAVLAAAPAMKKSKLRESLIENKDMALLSRRLVRLRDDAPLRFEPAAFRVVEPDRDVLLPLLTRLEFNKLIKDFAAAGPRPQADYRRLTDLDELARVLEQAKAAGQLAIDTETTSLDPIRADLVGFSLCVSPGLAYYAPLAHDWPADEPQAPRRQALDLLGQALADPGLLKIGQNLKYDLNVLRRAGLSVAGPLFDTMVADYLLNPAKASHGLEAIAAEHLGRGVIGFEEAVGGKGKGFAQAPPERAVPYAAEDADVALQAAQALGPKLDEADLRRLFDELEMPLTPLLAKMERYGVLIDAEELGRLSAELDQALAAGEQKIYALAGHEFNINSTQQLGQVLFDELGLSQVKKTKKRTAYSTDMSVLAILAAQHPLPAEVLAYRANAKLKSTYVDALPALINPDTGRVHTSFNQCVTATGRLSSSDPNLQNIPVRGELGRRMRGCFVPAPGRLLVSADYSQIELRVLAHLSQDPLMLQDMAEGLDVHTQTAARIFDVMPGLVTREMRARAKTVNFGVLYGMSAFRLAREQGVSRAEAEDIIARYLGRYQGVARFQQQNLSQCRQRGYVTTILGRRRFLPAINSSDRQAREAAERVALNTPIQGSAADIIKLAMLRVDEMLTRHYPDSPMILQVHDELVFETPEGGVEQFAQAVRRCMEDVLKLDVELKVDVGWGRDWAQAH
ncbi:DNA polymerase I [Desulfarculus baarsii]